VIPPGDCNHMAFWVRPKAANSILTPFLAEALFTLFCPSGPSPGGGGILDPPLGGCRLDPPGPKKSLFRTHGAPQFDPTTTPVLIFVQYGSKTAWCESFGFSLTILF